MKIIKLTSENIQKIKAVEIKPDGNLVVVGGKNAQGKTSLLDSITYALAGKRSFSEQPVRQGAKQGKIVLELDGDFIIERTIQETGNTTLKVTSKDGKRYSSPQRLLDGFVAKHTIDPLEFSRLEQAKQIEILKQVTGLDFSVELEVERELIEKRRFISAKARECSVLTAGKEWNTGPKEEISNVEVMNKIEEMNRLAETKVELRARGNFIIEGIRNKKTRIEALKREITELETAVAQDSQVVLGIKEQLSDMKVPDSSALQDKLKEIEEHNAQVRAYKEYVKTKQLEGECSKEIAELTSKIEHSKRIRKEKLAAARLPIPELEFDEEVVLYKGIPFKQCSGAERLRVSAAMGIAMAPELKILLIRDGSLLDEDNLQMLATMAEAHDAQVWIERVGEDEHVSVVLENGEAR